MDERDQRIYKIVHDRSPQISGFCEIFKGDKHIGLVCTVDDLSCVILRDYLDNSKTEYQEIIHIIVRRLNDMLTAALICRKRGLHGYVMCGVTIRECIRLIKNELK